MQFSQIYKHQAVKEKLVAAVKSNHIAHAQMFLGKPGSANLALALAYATYVNCENPSDQDSCGTCPSCSKYAKFVHPDLHFIYPVSTTKEVAKDAISSKFIEPWRTFIHEHPYRSLTDWSFHIGAENKQCIIAVEESRNLIRSLSLKSFEAKYKVVIIWLAEQMNQAAANSLLKVLEEPPEGTLFFLISDNSDKILTTILSRSQIVKIPSYSEEEVREILMERGIGEAAAEEASSLSGGNLNAALHLADELGGDNKQAMKDWLRRCYTNNYTELVAQADDFHKANKEGQKGFFHFGLNLMREALIIQSGELAVAKVAASDKEFITKFAGTMSQEKITKITDVLNEAYYHLERNASPKIVFLNTSLTLAGLLRS